MSKIEVINTGGTFNKVGDIGMLPDFNEWGFDLDNPNRAIREIIARSTRPTELNEELSINNLMQIDSLDMTFEHRTAITRAVVESEHEKILVLHGTDTMYKTARRIALARSTGLLEGKSVILTGAMEPYSLNPMHASYNFHFAIETLEKARDGVFLAMNAQLFHPWNVRKNHSSKMFEAISKQRPSAPHLRP